MEVEVLFQFLSSVSKVKLHYHIQKFTKAFEEFDFVEKYDKNFHPINRSLN
jgi:hypothetical protein